MINQEHGRLNWELSDLQFCKINRQRSAAYHYEPKLAPKNVLREYDNLDPVIYRDIFILLSDVGLPSHMDAITFLTEMITYCVKKGGTVRVHKELYPVISKRRNIAKSTVESTIRKTLVLAFDNGAAEKLTRIFKTNITECMGSGWFINTVTNWYVLNYKNFNRLYTDDREFFFTDK